MVRAVIIRPFGNISRKGTPQSQSNLTLTTLTTYQFAANPGITTFQQILYTEKSSI